LTAELRLRLVELIRLFCGEEGLGTLCKGLLLLIVLSFEKPLRVDATSTASPNLRLVEHAAPLRIVSLPVSVTSWSALESIFSIEGHGLVFKVLFAEGSRLRLVSFGLPRPELIVLFSILVFEGLLLLSNLVNRLNQRSNSLVLALLLWLRELLKLFDVKLVRVNFRPFSASLVAY